MIYFIESGGAVKIGYSKNPQRRFMALSTGCPTKCELIAVVEGDMDAERALHRKFSHLRKRGEWFAASSEISSFIASPEIHALQAPETKKPKTHLERAVEIFGSQKKLADAIGCSQQHVSLMIRGAVKTTAEMAVMIDRATEGQVSRAALRPDIFGAMERTS